MLLIRCISNHEEIGKYSKIITKIKPFIKKHNWKQINFTSENDDSKSFEENNQTIAPNVLHAKRQKIYPAYVSKHTLNREKQVILLTILNGKGWRCIKIKKISALLREMK